MDSFLALEPSRKGGYSVCVCVCVYLTLMEMQPHENSPVPNVSARLNHVSFGQLMRSTSRYLRCVTLLCVPRGDGRALAHQLLTAVATVGWKLGRSHLEAPQSSRKPLSTCVLEKGGRG